MKNKPQYCFRLLGARNAKRRLVDATAACSAYAACDPQCELKKEAYLSFWYGDDFRSYLSEYGTTQGFQGNCWSPYLWFDIDRGNLDNAHADTLTLCRYLGEEVEIYFTGSKGFHVGIATPADLAPSVMFNDICKLAALRIAANSGCGEIDPAVYVKVQPFRAPNSRHPKTGFYKRRLSWEQLTTLTIEQICDLAKSPAPFDWRLPEPSNTLAGVWCVAKNEVSAAGSLNTRSNAPGCPQNRSNPKHQPTQEGCCGRLNRATMDFIRDGATSGNRHRMLFSAAANLAELGCPVELAHALLAESALDSGLAPREVKRQIECGLRKGGECE